MGAARAGATGSRTRAAARGAVLCVLLAVAAVGCLLTAQASTPDGAPAPATAVLADATDPVAPDATSCAHCADHEGPMTACAIALLLVLSVLRPDRRAPSWTPRPLRRAVGTLRGVALAPPRAPSLHLLCVCRT